MPVSYLSPAQRESHGRFAGDPSADELGRYFHLNEDDHALIAQKRGDHGRLGFALQLTTVRFLGAFLDDPAEAPSAVLQMLSHQLGIGKPGCISRYRENRLQLGRWLYTLCWTGTDRPSVLFERAKDWLLTHKVLLPGTTVLERFVAKVRGRVEARHLH